MYLRFLGKSFLFKRKSFENVFLKSLDIPQYMAKFKGKKKQIAALIMMEMFVANS